MRAKAHRVVLLIDEDPKIGRLIRLNLHGPNWDVASCYFSEGLKMAAQLQPTLIVMETAFSNGDGLKLAKKLIQAPETKRCGIVFLTTDHSVKQRFAAIQMGVQDYLIKPLNGKQLRLKVEAICTTIEEHGLQGAVVSRATKQLLEVLQKVEQEASTGTLELERPGQRAMIRFFFGTVKEVEFGTLREDEALNAIARLGDWQTHFEILYPSGTSPRSGKGVKREQSMDPLDDDDDDILTVVDPNAHPLLEMDLAEIENPPTDTSGQAAEEYSPRPEIESLEPRRYDLKTNSRDEFFDDGPTMLQPSAEDLKTNPQSESLTLDDLRSSYEEQHLLSNGLPPASFEKPTRHQTAGPKKEHHQAPPEISETIEIGQWFVEQPQPLLLIINNHQVRQALEEAAKDKGVSTIRASNGQEGYRQTVQSLPLAVICDMAISDMQGRDLLGGIRVDFMIRETPFLLLSSEELAPQVSKLGVSAVAPIFSGLESALRPRALFHQKLRAGTRELRVCDKINPSYRGSRGAHLARHDEDEYTDVFNRRVTPPGGMVRLPNAGVILSQTLTGQVKSIGISNLLGMLGAFQVTGKLQLHKGEQANAEVIFRRGEIYSAMIQASQSSIGPMAMLHLLAYEWYTYSYVWTTVSESQASLDGQQMSVQTACRQNNTLIARIYEQGTQYDDDVTIDYRALDQYLQILPPDSVELLTRLIEGEPAAELAGMGTATPGLLKSILFDLRRKAIIHPASLRPVYPPRVQKKQQHRWPVMVIAGVATMALAAGSYLLYHLFRQ